MLHKLIQSFKVEIKAKDVAIWFAVSFIGVLLAYVFIKKRTFEPSLLIEVSGFAAVFVLLMMGTKSYSHFIDGYYQSYIDRHDRKMKNKKTKRNRKS